MVNNKPDVPSEVMGAPPTKKVFFLINRGRTKMDSWPEMLSPSATFFETRKERFGATNWLGAMLSSQ